MKINGWRLKLANQQPQPFHCVTMKFLSPINAFHFLSTRQFILVAIMCWLRSLTGMFIASTQTKHGHNPQYILSLT